ncbi:DUF72 domain-containing protein [Pedobacter sp. ASV28]|uniref:DUF72 domain-containing protein n=1 Tax=Pedobacter sp. ASV28 TaxID=2795123 RepID=UPI0018ECD4AD|nr:DUF72 domain-containing protein [Pedobacter sp. ASV28]
MDWKIGCSGFYYKEWKEAFYPKGLAPKDWFHYYAEHFNTIEINSTFYKMPTIKSLAKWHEESPSAFSFTIKAPRIITHYQQLKDSEELLIDFYKTIQSGLQEKLACVLFQFPPSFSYNTMRLELLIKILDPSFVNVVEFRHPSWWKEDLYHQLTAHDIIFAGQSYPSELPSLLIKNNPTVYYRFHGKPILYKSEYQINSLKALVSQVPDDTKTIFVYFNNTWGMGALHNAKQLKLLTGN